MRWDGAGGIIGEVDRNHLRIGPKRRPNRIDIERPIIAFIQRHAAYCADRKRDSLGCLVVGRDDDAVIVGLEQHPHRYINALFSSGKAQQLLICDGVIGFGYFTQQRFRAGLA